MSTKELLQRFDFILEMLENIRDYFKRNKYTSFSVGRNTYYIIKSQFINLYKSNKTKILGNEGLYTYYECISSEFIFIDNNLDDEIEFTPTDINWFK